ncbi:MAG: hypothetical protein LBU53_06280 [Zoogloeaceae bacterium]|jgi:hypothetical protein|nr:hypothetical protein [Zoogloeaceae bacterium]
MLIWSDKTRRSLFALALFSASVPVWGAPPDVIAPSAGQSVCCVEASGQRVCSDIAPPQCNGRALKIYNRQGLLVREVAARKSAEEQAAIKQQEALEQQAKVAAYAQRLKDRALLDTYTSLEALDRTQKRQEEDAKTVISDVRSRLDAAKKRKQELDAEAEFYASSPKAAPADLTKQIQDEEFEIKSQTTLLATKQKDLDQIRKKFAEDRQRYIELTSNAN